MTTREERNAEHAIARAEAYEVSLANYSVKSAPAPTSTPVSHGFTDAEITKMIHDQVAEQVERGIAAYHEGMELRPVTCAMYRRIRKEVSAEIGQLRADVVVERAHAGGDRAGVVELPRFMAKRGSDAA